VFSVYSCGFRAKGGGDGDITVLNLNIDDRCSKPFHFFYFLPASIPHFLRTVLEVPDCLVFKRRFDPHKSTRALLSRKMIKAHGSLMNYIGMHQGSRSRSWKTFNLPSVHPDLDIPERSLRNLTKILRSGIPLHVGNRKRSMVKPEQARLAAQIVWRLARHDEVGDREVTQGRGYGPSLRHRVAHALQWRSERWEGIVRTCTEEVMRPGSTMGFDIPHPSPWETSRTSSHTPFHWMGPSRAVKRLWTHQSKMLIPSTVREYISHLVRVHTKA